MITEMKKLYLVVHKNTAPEFINKLQDMGAVHIVQEEVKNEDLSDLLTLKNRLKGLYKTFHKVEHDKQIKYDGELEELLSLYEKKAKRIEELETSLIKIRKDYTQLHPWGDFDNSKIEKLSKDRDVHITLYRIPIKGFNEYDFRKDLNTYLVSADYSTVYFAVIDEGKVTDIPVEKVILPNVSLKECKRLIKKDEDEIEKLKGEIAKLVCYKEYVDGEAKRVEDQLRNRKANMSLKVHHEKISTVCGWIPSEKEAEIKGFLDKSDDIVFEIEEASDSDDVPVLLKNSKFSKLFEPITKLFDLPAYMEFDLTPFFAPFFAMFFGLCLGDAGYGLILLVATGVAFFKFKDFRPIILLGMILSVCTIFWGLLTGTTFGVNMFETKVPVLSSIAVLKSTHVFYLALLIGLVQILFGMAVQAIKRIAFERDLAGVSTIGWFLLVVFLTILYLSGKEPVEGFVIGTGVINFCKSVPLNVGYAGSILGLVLILFFNDMKVNIFIRFGKGLWEIYGITGVAGDLLSYIRLFALGISSAILGTVINSIALQILDIGVPVLSQVLFILFLVGGHLGNMLLAALGSFVHPLRLTFVEFYKNAGFVGGGKPYDPLRRECR